MSPKTILVTGRDAFIGSVITHAVEMRLTKSICKYCSRGPETLKCILEMHPDLIILDLFLPGLNGLSILKAIPTEDYCPLILAYCRHLNKMVGVKCAMAGVTGLIDYSFDSTQASACLDQVCWGKKSYPNEVWELLDEHDYEKHFQKYTDVTARQAQILELITLGFSNMEISRKLEISVKTVEKHKRVIKDKFGLTSMAEVVHFAIRNGIIEREEEICS